MEGPAGEKKKETAGGGSMILDELKKLIEEYEVMKTRLFYAKIHIKKKITCFTPEELECMVMDGIIEPEDVPEDKRTRYVKSEIELREKVKKNE